MDHSQNTKKSFEPFSLSNIALRISLSLLGASSVLALLIPYHFAPLPSFFGEWVAIALGLFAASFAMLQKNFWQPLHVPIVSRFLLVLLILILVQSLVITPDYSAQTLLPAFYVVWSVMISLLASWLSRTLGSDSVLVTLAWFILIGGILQGLIALAQYADAYGWLADMIDPRQPGAISGNIGQSNHFATQLTMASVALIFLFSQRALSFSLCILLLCLFIFGLTVSGSRSVFLYSGAICLFALAVARGLHDKVAKKRLISTSACLAISVVLAQIFFPLFDHWVDRTLIDLGWRSESTTIVRAFDRGTADGIQLRLSEWHKAFLIWLQAPFFGTGFGQYGWHSFLYQSLPDFSKVAKPELFHHTHNLFVQVIVELGIVGLILIAAFTIRWLKQFIAQKWRIQEFFVGSLLLVLFTHSNLEYPLWYSYFLVLAVSLLTLSDRSTLQVSTTPLMGRIGSASLTLFGIAMLALCLVGYMHIARISAGLFIGSPAQEAALLSSIAKNRFLAPWAEATLANTGKPDVARIEEQLALTTRNMRHNPDKSRVYRQTMYLAYANQTSAAIELLHRAATVYPNDLAWYIQRLESRGDDELQVLITEAKKISNANALQLQERTKEMALVE